MNDKEAPSKQVTEEQNASNPFEKEVIKAALKWRRFVKKHYGAMSAPEWELYQTVGYMKKFDKEAQKYKQEKEDND